MEKKLVLVVEDYGSYFQRIQADLGDKVEILWAKTKETAKEFFENKCKNLALIIMDACVPGDEPNTMELVEKIKASNKFKGPIIACSAIDEYREKLLNAGATHEADKRGAGKLALELLGLT